MKPFRTSFCLLAMGVGFAIGATQSLPAPQLDANALLGPTIVVAKSTTTASRF